jgi:hypothetical protein
MSSTVLIPPGEVVRVVLTYVYGQSFCQHRLHFIVKSPIIDLQLALLHLQVYLCDEILHANMVDSARLLSISMTTVGAAAIFEQTYMPQTPDGGRLPGQGTAPIVAHIWQLRTNSSGKQGRGRLMTFALPLSWIDNHRNLSTVTYENPRGAASAIMQRFGDGGEDIFFQIGVFSYKQFRSTEDSSSSFAPVDFINVPFRLSSRSSRRF